MTDKPQIIVAPTRKGRFVADYIKAAVRVGRKVTLDEADAAYDASVADRRA